MVLCLSPLGRRLDGPIEGEGRSSAEDRLALENALPLGNCEGVILAVFRSHGGVKLGFNRWNGISSVAKEG